MKLHFRFLAWVPTIVLATALASGQTRPAFPSAADLVWTVNAKVENGGGPNTFKYLYSISNSSRSRLELAQWAIDHASPESFSITGTPIGWVKNEKIGGGSMAGWTGISTVLQKGSSQSGFEIEANGLPGIVKAVAMGDIPVDQLPKFPEGQAPEDLPGSSILDNSAQTKTVGPVPVPLEFNPLTFLARVIALKEEAFKRGWISSSEVRRSLDAKLDAAQQALQRGNNGAARNQLNALLNEVTAQTGKELSPEAVALLRFNTEFLISKIP